MVKGVIFDMDGTMFDTERLLTIAWHKAAGEMGVTISTELMDACRGKSTQAIGGLLRAEFGEDFDYDRICMFKNKIYHEIIEKDGVPLKKGLKELLEFLKEQKIPAAVATSTGKNSAEMVLKKAGVYDVLSAHMYGDMLKASKPEPDIFLEAAKKIGREPKECLVMKSALREFWLEAAGDYVIYILDVMKVPEEVERRNYSRIAGSVPCDRMDQRRKQEVILDVRSRNSKVTGNH